MKTNLVLIGFRGIGKSTIGTMIAPKLNLKFVSIDKIIIQKIKMPIEQFINKKSWNDFRDIESKLCLSLKNKNHTLIDCGGGIVERDSNMAALKVKGLIFYLYASLETVLKRIEKNPSRPPLIKTSINFKKECKIIYQKRRPLYEKHSDMKIDINEESISTCSEKVIQHYNHYLENRNARR